MRCSLVLVLLLASVAGAQQPEPPKAPEPAAEPQRLLIRLGTPRFEVEAMMGRDIFSSVLPALKRRKQIYADDTQIVFVDDYVISVRPGRDAQRDGDGNYVLERDSSIVVFHPETLSRCGRLISDDCIKCQVDRAFYHLLEPLRPRYVSPLPPVDRRIGPKLDRNAPPEMPQP